MKKISRILLPVDFSDHGAGAATYAGMLAKHFGARIILLHVNPLFIPGLALPREFSGPLDVGWVTAFEAQRRRDLDSYQIAPLHGISLDRVVVTGDPAHCIVEQAHRENVDLIVMPTRGYGRFRRFLLGSVAAKVLDDANCPVWTGSHLEGSNSTGRITSVLCAIDNGPATERVLHWAWGFAREFQAALTVLHVVSKLETPDDFLAAEAVTQRDKEAQSTVRCFLTKAGICADILIEKGEPSTVVARTAEHVHANVTVIGRSSKTGGLGRLRPHVYSIIRESPCPVVSI